MWHLTACKIYVCLSFLKWNDFLSYLWINVEMIFYRISELMLPTLIQRYDKNHFIFDPVQKRDQLKFYRRSDAAFYIIV